MENYYWNASCPSTRLFQISDEMVWATIQTELQPLKEKIEQYKRELE